MVSVLPRLLLILTPSSVREPVSIQKRAKDWGPGEFDRKAAAFWHEATLKSRDWLTIQTGTGVEAVKGAYFDVLTGKTPADKSWVVCL